MAELFEIGIFPLILTLACDMLYLIVLPFFGEILL